jgi:sulfatase maturation enzyme AslB (radical SAM superfamily)/Tfp pilus assembly protein PilF
MSTRNSGRSNVKAAKPGSAKKPNRCKESPLNTSKWQPFVVALGTPNVGSAAPAPPPPIVTEAPTIETRCSIAVGLMQQGRFMEASRQFGKLLETNPNDVSASLGRIRCELEQGDVVAARLNCLRALRIDPANAEAQNILNRIESGEIKPARPRSVLPSACLRPFVPTLDMLWREYPCPAPFSQLYVVPRGHLDVRFCSYHPPVIVPDPAGVYERGIEAFDSLLNSDPQFLERRARYLAGDCKGAGCSENCIWYNRWKTTGKGFKLGDYLGADGRFKLGKIWLSMGPDCNVTCRYCLEPSEFKMDFNTCDPAIMNMARDFVRRGGELLLTGGETFLPKWGFARILEELVNWGDATGSINLHTNGTYLNEKNRDLLLRGPVHAVGISMDTLRKDLYEYLRRGTRFETVWHNATSLVRERNQRGLKSPHIVLLCAVLKSTAPHLVETVDRAVKAGLGISLNALFQAYYSPAFSEREGLHNLSADELKKLYEDVLHLEKKYGPNSAVNYQGFKGQLENQLQLLESNAGERQVILGGGGHSARLPHFTIVERAEELLAAGQFREAADQIEPLLPKLKKSTRGLHAWAAILSGLNRIDEAAETYHAILKLDPRDEVARAALEQISPILNHPGASNNPEVCKDSI